jgi:hypothetical protein
MDKEPRPDDSDSLSSDDPGEIETKLSMGDSMSDNDPGEIGTELNIRGERPTEDDPGTVVIEGHLYEEPPPRTRRRRRR